MIIQLGLIVHVQAPVTDRTVQIGDQLEFAQVVFIPPGLVTCDRSTLLQGLLKGQVYSPSQLIGLAGIGRQLQCYQAGAQRKRGVADIEGQYHGVVQRQSPQFQRFGAVYRDQREELTAAGTSNQAGIREFIAQPLREAQQDFVAELNTERIVDV